MKKGIWGIWCGIGVLVIILNAQSASATMVMATDFGENDCSGFFGQGFGSCQIFSNPDDDNWPIGETTVLSPVIIKFTTLLAVSEINDGLYDTVDGSEFSFTNLVDGPPDPPDPIDKNISGTWTYTPDLHDPGIKYWAAKAGNDFKLFWEVPDSAAATGGVCETNPFTIACLNEALVVTTGDWTTPLSKNLSHLTLYDTEPVTNGETPPITPIPEPATMLLLGTGLVGVAGAARRRKKKQV